MPAINKWFAGMARSYTSYKYLMHATLLAANRMIALPELLDKHESM